MAETSLSGAGSRDFDFFHGHWRVAHRRLKDRLTGSNDWEEFGGQCICQPTLGGFGNFDDNILELPQGSYRALTIRSFDAQSATWSIWWLDGRTPANLDIPVIGGFRGNIGEFTARDMWQGRAMLVRFRWEASASPTWEQAMSIDDGKSWEMNWHMRFTRDDTVQL